ncbi:MAG: hypothetical protein HYX68_02455 [Planctomycetes bacterium]|nr:hypothetical protein [Planctomycetota bacterium]
MFKKYFPALIASVVILASAAGAQAQHLDMSQMVQNELNFQKRFYNWAWQGSVQAARWHRENGVPIPFNAATIYQSNLEGQRAFNGYIRQSQINSERTSQAIGNWTNGAIRGMGPYYNPSNGAVYNLPWTHNQYHMNRYGQFAPGYNPHRDNVFPYYGR